ncbi:GNAT family N-acetyltransferase [Streptomyces sp. NPDC101118]|uniref:GNAT family N-acetyltransferase n=1 Tax=Streptomyces sp. NPDC101118 TaxID=3366109 RepID=UPI0037FF1164
MPGTDVLLRAARPEEAAALSGLMLRSKAHWGYDDAFLKSCVPELTLLAGEVTRRRIVVAERRGEVLGLASLEGEAPVVRLGLLFVEPRAVRQGVGGALYRDALARARRLGAGRLLVEADPHAVPFYTAVGARPVPGAPRGLPCFEVELAGTPAWVRAWTGGRRAVHLGNVAEYNRQFADPTLDEAQEPAHHYSCLAAFYSPHPAALVLPLTVPEGWLATVSRQLGWGEVELYDGLAEGTSGRGGVRSGLAARPALAARLRETGLPMVSWGETGAAALRYESKSAANALFRRLTETGRHPGIRVPEQTYAAARWRAARLLRARARAGETAVLKTEHGVGGSGTAVVAPGAARAVLRRLPRGPLLVEEYVEGVPEGGDLTYDGLVDATGRVHDVGAAVMEVAGTAYRGATVGPGVVPAVLEEAALAFGHAVGRELAADGYRGWFDVDFVADRAGRLAPTETNLRLTGPSVAFMVGARLDELRGAGHLVRIVDRVPLGARLPDAGLAEHVAALTAGCAELGVLLLPAVPTAAFAPSPYLGVLLASHSRPSLDAADALVRRASSALATMFTG